MEEREGGEGRAGGIDVGRGEEVVDILLDGQRSPGARRGHTTRPRSTRSAPPRQPAQQARRAAAISGRRAPEDLNFPFRLEPPRPLERSARTERDRIVL